MREACSFNNLSQKLGLDLVCSHLVSVAHANGSYSVMIGESLIEPTLGIVGEIISSADKIILIVDKNLSEEIILSFNKSFSDLIGKPLVIPVVGGEESKSFSTFSALCELILSHNITRDSLVVAIGGGSLGDVSGYIASSLLRGLRLVHIPTTLLAMVDSSIGGKTAINSRYGKNLIGSIHPPEAVVIDTDFLSSLPERHYKSAYAEVVKYAVINDYQFFELLENNVELILKKDKNILYQVILSSVTCKKLIVEADEQESDIRSLLNLGHTFGHALETLHSYSGSLNHGESVSIGIVVACRFSHRLGILSEEDAERISRLLSRLGLPIDIPTNTDIEEMLSLMQRDKKNRSSLIKLVLPSLIGKTFIHEGLEIGLIGDFLNDLTS